MTQVMNDIKVVQYHEGWAKQVAKMWNLSREGWGGDTRVMTEEQVIQKEAHSENIALFLAVDGEEVVGYCGLSEYKDDFGSLYIPLLNVRPDYQGQKIGKKLVLRALEKTVELGWSRLDLYTWAGNTKAVPLYKKCGFFWEERDDSTHLMNFIPLVMKTPLLKPVFNKMDWYESSERVIEVKPDGMKENGFTFFEYKWSNGQQFARVQIERTGRGISLIETDDFLIQLVMNEHSIIEQEEQEYQIRFINKTGSAVTLRANGSGSERVVYDLNQELVVENESTITGKFTVQPGEEPSPWRTHPSLSVNVIVGDLECDLKLGLFPLQPAKIEAFYSGNLSFINKETSIDLVVKNNLKEDAEYSILFPNDSAVTLKSNRLHVFLPAGSKQCLPLPLVIDKYGFYQPTLQIVAKKKDGSEISFEHTISLAFKGLGEKFGGESKDYWHIYNGMSQVNIRKRDLLLTAAKNNLKNQPLAFFPAKLGKPYTNEFAKKKPELISWISTDTSILLKMELISDEMEGLYVCQFIELFGEGILHKWVEVENRGAVGHEEVAISESHFHELGYTYFPLNNGVTYFTEDRILEFGDLKPNSITENWYFSENKPYPIGISWSKDSKASPEGWQFVIENDLGAIAPGEKKISNKVVVSIGAFHQWDEFKAYAQEAINSDKQSLYSEYIFESSKMIVDSNLTLSLKANRNNYLSGSLQVSTAEEIILDEVFTSDSEKTELTFDTETKSLKPITVLEGELKENGITTNFTELVLYPSPKVVETKKVETDSYSTFEATNGCLTLKAAPDFYPGIYSLMVNGDEWLDHSFPNRTAKSWWNPWAGGLKTAPSGLTSFSLLKEKHTVAPTEKWDQEGNKWSGLSIRTEIKEHREWKDVVYNQYYLMLPGVPILASYLEVEQTGGRNLKEDMWVTDFFVGGEDLVNLSLNVNNSHQSKQYNMGVQELPMNFEVDSYITSNTKKDRLYLVPSLYMTQREAYTNNHAFQVMQTQKAVPTKNSSITAPFFIVFDQRHFNTELLQRLQRVQF
jgi:ribosomal protein S18 acetylase RimI-like enzyme